MVSHMETCLQKCALALFFVLFAGTAAASDSQTLFTLNRTNYKPNKTLHYELKFDAGACTIDKSSPLEVYYLVDEGGSVSKQAMSEDSKDYFGPTWKSSDVKADKMTFTFYALTKFENVAPSERKITVVLEKSGGECVAEAKITYGDDSYVLNGIRTKVKKLLGIPSGVEWVALDVDGGSLCVVGSCH